MTKQPSSSLPPLYLTAPGPCPYLEGREERKVFTHLAGGDASMLNSLLTHAGFRRSQNIAYRPACEGCNACVSVRVVVDAFEERASFRRVRKRNADLVRNAGAAHATPEQFELLRHYLDARHNEGGMADMTVYDYRSMVEETEARCHVVEYRCAEAGPDGPILAAALTDMLEDGLSMVYSFFETAERDRGLGTYMVLDHIQWARELGLPFVYLGYWVEGSRKMDYKIRYRPLEALGPAGWRRLTD